MGIQFKLKTFEGPLDLLLHLIDKNEVDIHDIPIAQITDQYMHYLQELPSLELDATSEFLVMAATLLAIKSKMLLPKPPVVDLGLDEEEEDPRHELVQRLLEYRKYKALAEELKEKELERSLIFTREPIDFSPFMPEHKEHPLSGVMLADIMMAFQNMLKRTAARNRVAKIKRDEISVKDRVQQLIGMFREPGDQVLFSSLLSDEWDRDEVVVSFLAVLELMKLKRIRCYQNGLFDDIVIQYKGEGEPNGDQADEIDY